MKLASFIVISAVLHVAVLVQPFSFPQWEREQILPVTIISHDVEGSAGSNRTTLVNQAPSGPSRANAPENFSEPRFSASLSIVTDKIAAPDHSVDVSEGLSTPSSAEFASHGVAILGTGDGSGFGRASTGTGNSEVGTGAGTGQGLGNGDGQYRQARYIDGPKPKIPESARRAGKEGRVFLRVLIDEQGRSAAVEINRSSGEAALDQAAVDAVKRWRFLPARLGNKSVESWLRIPIEFRRVDAQE